MLLLNLWLTCGSLSLPCDGGNDVNMIQAADCGIGIEGKVNNPYYASYPIHLLLHEIVKTLYFFTKMQNLLPHI